MATIVSAQSGNWEDTTTWVGGVVPIGTDDVVVSTGHIVVYNVKTTHAAKVTLQGTLNIASGIEFMFGARNGVTAHLYFDGGTLGGQGAVRINKGSCTTNPDKWSYVRDGVSLSASAASYQDACTWNLEKLSFVSSGSFTPQYKVPSFGEATNTFRIYDCVIVGASKLSLGVAGSIIPQSMTLEQVTILNTPIDTLGTGASNKLVNFKRCTIVGTSFRLLAVNSPTVFNDCFVRGNISSAAYGFSYENCFALNKTTGSGGYYISISSSPNSAISQSIIYCPSTSADNTRAGEVAHVTNCYLEDNSLGDGNGFMGGAAQNFPRTFTDNVCVGSVSFFTGQQTSDFPFDYTITGNTVYAVNGSAAATLVAFESYVPASGSDIKIKNNLTYRDGNSNNVIYAIKYGDAPFAQTIDVDFDYNVAYNQNWYRTDGLINNSSGANLLPNIDPNFKDTTRNISSWALKTIGADDFDSILEYFRGMLGYEESSGTHSGIALPTSIISDTRDWLVEGYTPQNMELATAGEGGTYVGALMPKEPIVETSDISLSANATTVVVGGTVIYTATLTDVLSTALNVTVTIGGVDKSLTIDTGALTGNLSHVTTGTGDLVASVKNTDNPNVSIVGGSVTVTVQSVVPDTAQLSLSSSVTSVLVGESIPYTLTLSKALADDVNATLDVSGASLSVRIQAGQTSASTSFVTSNSGVLSARIASTSNPNAIITGNVVNVTVNKIPVPTGDLWRVLDVVSVDKDNVNLSVPSGVSGELTITLTYTKE